MPPYFEHAKCCWLHRARGPGKLWQNQSRQCCRLYRRKCHVDVEVVVVSIMTIIVDATCQALDKFVEVLSDSGRSFPRFDLETLATYCVYVTRK